MSQLKIDLTTDIRLNGERLKVFPLRSRTRQECPLLKLLIKVTVL